MSPVPNSISSLVHFSIQYTVYVHCRKYQCDLAAAGWEETEFILVIVKLKLIEFFPVLQKSILILICSFNIDTVFFLHFLRLN